MKQAVALIVGAGPGISGAFAKALRAQGYTVALAARQRDRVEALAASIGARAFVTDVSSTDQVRQLFRDVDQALGEPEVVLYNASARVRGDILSLDASAVAGAVHTTAMGAFVVAQEAARRMLPKKRGAIFFTGATASVKGFAQSSAFAMGKFAVRGLAQSLARELAPAGIHVAHFVIDGAVQPNPTQANALSAEAIAQSYMAVLAQPLAAWTWEIELRSHTESF